VKYAPEKQNTKRISPQLNTLLVPGSTGQKFHGVKAQRFIGFLSHFGKANEKGTG
jgi:hypothetical protein